MRVFRVYAILLMTFCSVFAAEKKVMKDSRHVLRGRVKIDGKTYFVHERGAKMSIIVTDRTAAIADRQTAGHAAVTLETFDFWRGAEMSKLRVQQKENISKYLKYAALCQAALFMRDAAAGAVVDVAVVHATGGSAALTRKAGKKITVKVLKDTARKMASNPENYLRAFILKVLNDCGKDLSAVSSGIKEIEKAGVVDSGKVNELTALSVKTYRNIVPAMKLYDDVKPGASPLDQLKSVRGVMEKRLMEQVPGVSVMNHAHAEKACKGMGAKLHETFEKFKPYANFLLERDKYRKMVIDRLRTVEKTALEKVAVGRKASAGFTHFGEPQKADVDEAGRGKEKVFHLGPVPPKKGAMTFKFTLPKGFESVCVCVDFDKKPPGIMYGGYKSKLAVNDKPVWTYLGKVRQRNSYVYQNHLTGKKIRTREGRKGSCDISKLVKAGGNTVTFSHSSGADCFVVIVYVFGKK